MCFVLYMASNKPRREIPWDDKAPAFYVSGNDADIQKVKHQFSKAHVYYVGSSSNCGCNYRRHPEWVYDTLTTEEQKTTQENQDKLHKYLSECLDDEGEIELFGCWSGDEGTKAQNARCIQVDELLKKEFYFEDNKPELIVVKRS